MRFGNSAFNAIERLPSEHGFWVMLGAAQASALLRTKGAPQSLAVAALVAGVAISVASFSHRRIRKSSAGQLAGTLALALSSVPVEIAGGVSVPSIGSSSLARGVVFVTSALVVRAAFARSARDGKRSNLLLRIVCVAIPVLVAALLFALDRPMEAGTCVIAGAAFTVFAWSRPTAKQLKPLGLALGGLAVITAVTLAL